MEVGGQHHAPIHSNANTKSSNFERLLLMIDGRLLQDTAHMKLEVLSAVHSIVEAWKLVTLTAHNNCFAKCGLQLDHVCINDDNAKNLVTMNKMTGTVCNLFECSLRITLHVRVLSKYVESRALVRCWTSSSPGQKTNKKRKERQKWQKIQWHFWMH